jgi:hypothetical protein
MSHWANTCSGASETQIYLRLLYAIAVLRDVAPCAPNGRIQAEHVGVKGVY